MWCQKQWRGRTGHWCRFGAVSSDQEVLGLQMINMSAVSTFGTKCLSWLSCFSWRPCGAMAVSKLVQMAPAGRVRSSFTNGRWQGAAASPDPSSPHLCWEGGRSASHQAQDLAARLDSFSGSQTALSKFPWMWECSAPNQTSAPHWKPSWWSWVPWEFPALWRSAGTDIGLDVNLKAQSFAPKPLHTKPSVLGLAAGAGCRRLRICAEEKPSALTHCSTTSYFWQKLAQAA